MHLLKGLNYLWPYQPFLGIAIVIWVLDNVFVETLSQYTGSTFITGLGSFGISIPMVSVIILWLNRGIRQLEKNKE